MQAEQSKKTRCFIKKIMNDTNILSIIQQTIDGEVLQGQEIMEEVFSIIHEITTEENRSQLAKIA